MKSLDELNQAFQEALTHTADVPEGMAQWQEALQAYIEEHSPTQEELEPYLEEWRRILQVNKYMLQEHQEKLKDKIKIGEKDAKKLKAAGKYQEH